MDKISVSRYSKYFVIILLIYSIIIAAICLSFDVFNTLKYSGIDLRNRVVAARVFQDGRDPYFTKWRETTPQYLVDGRDYFATLPVSRYTGTPALLLLHLPFAGIDYKVQQIVWMILQEILLVISILLLAKLAGKRYKLIMILGFMFIFGSYFWRFHVGNGQIYILFTFIMILAYFLVKQSVRYSELIAGFLLGFAVTWRPPLIIMGLPFLIYKKWKIILGGIFGLISSMILSVIFLGYEVWNSYFLAMNIHGYFHIDLIDTKLGFAPFFNNIEGIYNTFFSADLPAIDSSFQKIFHKYLGITLDGAVFWLALAVIIYFFAIYLWQKHRQTINDNLIYLIAFSLVLFSEYFIPANRLSYNNVIWLPILALILINSRDMKRLLHFDLIFLLAGLLLNYLYRLNFYTILAADYCILIYVVIENFRLLREHTGTSTVSE